VTVPYDYLRRVAGQLDAPYLRPDDQSAALGALEYALANESDPSVRPYALHLLGRLVARPDTVPSVAERGRAVLWTHERMQPPPPPFAQPSPYPQPSPFAQPAPTPTPPPPPARKNRSGVVIASVLGVLLLFGLLARGVAAADNGRSQPVPPAPTTSAAPRTTTPAPTTTTAAPTSTPSNRSGVTIAGPTTARVGAQTEYTVDGPSTNTDCLWVLSGNGQPDQRHSGCDGVTVTWQVPGTYYLAVAWTDTVTNQTDSTAITIQTR